MKLLPWHVASTKQRNSEGAQRGVHCCRNSNIVLLLDIFFLQLKGAFKKTKIRTPKKKKGAFCYHQSCHWLVKTKYGSNKSSSLSVFFFLIRALFFWPWPWHVKVPGPGIKPAPQQQPNPLQ